MTKVLIVDDQMPFRVAARMAVMRIPSWEVVGEAASGEEGMGLVDSLEPGLVLMDINMEGIDGFEATRRIRATRPDTVVFLVSTYAVEDLPESPASCGAAAYIPKEELTPRLLLETWGSVAG